MAKPKTTPYRDTRYRLLPVPDLDEFALTFGVGTKQVDVPFRRLLDFGVDLIRKRKTYFNPGKGPISVWEPLETLNRPPGTQTLTVFCSDAVFDPRGLGRKILHVSMNTVGLPADYGLLKQLRDLFFPADIDVLQVMPKADNYVNVHESVYHLWQSPFDWEVWGV